MEMEMDIPQPDELEWLEANGHDDDDDDDVLDIPLPPEEDYGHPQSTTPQSPAPSIDPQSNGPKRPRSDGSDSPEEVPPEDKRSRVDDGAGLEVEDEDWLRYPNGADEEEEMEAAVVLERGKVLSRYASEIDGDFVPVTAPSGGDRVYAKICRVDWEERSKKLDFKFQSKGLVSEPIDVLLQKLDQEAFTKALQASSKVQDDVVSLETRVVHEQLWVDKYAPNSFTELLSDEQTNREVLLWLKQWDSSVFGSEIRSTEDEVLSALRRHYSVTQHQKPSDSTFFRKSRGHRWTHGNFRQTYKEDQEKNNLRGVQDLWNKKSRLTGPPEQKILLLCGPPGLGKTTLAHVAAKHCGYRVVEINASDDRSSSTIEAKILDVVQMNSVTVDSRPKCLVIDEIDGALGDGRGAVDVILKMVSTEKKLDSVKENAAKGEQSGRTSSKKGRKASSLSRPVICICNDLYAPALRPLRQVAKVHIFVQPTVSRVVSRLKYICNKEGIKTSSIALTALAEYTECDIRSCLNTLQFLNKKKEALNVLDIGSQLVGRKDMSRSVFDIWKEIFQKKKIKRERKSDVAQSSMSNEFYSLHSLISNRGDFDVIFDGIHENILQLHYHDPLMEKTVKCFNSLGVSDQLHQYIMRTQQMPLYAYQPHIAISIHRLVAQVQKPNIEWPKSYHRYRTTLMDKTDILRSWQRKIPPYISRHLSTKSFVEDSISPLLHILSPATLRPVALHLLSEKEKNVLSQLVSTMVSYSITYKNIKCSSLSSDQEREAALDSLALSFDPPICDFINFKGFHSGHHVLPLATKQVLVHEVEKQRILLVSKTTHLMDECNQENLHLVKGKITEARSTNMAAASVANIENARDIQNPMRSNPNGSTTSTTLESSRSGMSSVKPPGNQKKRSSGSINFFDRFKKASGKGSQDSNSSIQKATTLERDSRPLLFKFNEGFTNAIKRPVRMRDFL